MILWTIALTLSLIFLFLLVLMVLRKTQFDAIHQNFLDLEDEFGGKVIRHGFATRPRYLGEYRGRQTTVSITTEKTEKGQRLYYLAITMNASSAVNFTIMSTEWLERSEATPNQEASTIALLEGQYLLQTPQPAQLKKLNPKQIEADIRALHPFAYILMAGNDLMLERISQHIVNDTKAEPIKALFEGLYQLQSRLTIAGK